VLAPVVMQGMAAGILKVITCKRIMFVSFITEEDIGRNMQKIFASS
jgi:hypothetical protein